MAHQRTQTVINLVFCLLLIGPQKPHYIPQTCFSYLHMQALGMFPMLSANSQLGSMSHRKGLHPGKCLGITPGHWTAAGSCLVSAPPSWLTLPTRTNMAAALCKDANFPALLICASSSGSTFFIYSYSGNSTENSLYIGIDSMVLP